MQPLDYLHRYEAITVFEPSGLALMGTGIKLKRYLLGTKQKNVDERVRLLRKIQADFRAGKKKDPAYQLTVRVQSRWGVEVKTYADITTDENDPLWTLIRYCYVGKGSPEGIQIALQLAASDGPGGKALIDPNDMQKYCDEFFGLDCNGFVGNYLRDGVQGRLWWDAPVNNDKTGISPDDLIPDIWNKAIGIERTSAAAINPADLNLLVLVDDKGEIVRGGDVNKPGHIMISQPGESTSTQWTKTNLGVQGQAVPAIRVAESTGARQHDGGNGLSDTWYHYVEDPRLKHKGVFLVDRGLGNQTMRVRIKAMGPVQ